MPNKVQLHIALQFSIITQQISFCQAFLSRFYGIFTYIFKFCAVADTILPQNFLHIPQKLPSDKSESSFI
jgi:hypothetical protein